MSHHCYLETKPWKSYKEEAEAAVSRGQLSRGVYVDDDDDDDDEAPGEGGGEFVACTLFPPWEYPGDSSAGELAERVDFVLDPVNRVKALVVKRSFPAHVLRLLASLPPCVRHLTIESISVTLPTELYACWAPPFSSARLLLPGVAADGASAPRGRRRRAGRSDP
jgi:hypothetical protein